MNNKDGSYQYQGKQGSFLKVFETKPNLIKGKKTMMKKVTILTLTILVFTLLVFQISFAEMEGNKRVILQVETKDPIRTYSLSLPAIWGPLAAHNYLASSPIKWGEDIPGIKSKAIIYALLNTITIVGGIVLMSYEEPFPLTLGMALALIGPRVENHFFGNYCAKWAVDYNKKLYNQFNYESPPVSPNLQEEEIRLFWNTQF